MFKVNISRQAEKFLNNIQPKHARQIAVKITELQENPLPHDSIELKGSAYRRADVGEYRIIYWVESDTLMIVVIGKRNDDQVYKILDKKQK